jgi:hypothetical protein
MKKYIIALVALSAAASVLAQGTVTFNNRIAGTLITHVYMPEAVNPDVQVTGNAANDTPSAATAYTGALVSGADWTAQLWAAPGNDAAEGSLQAATPTTTFRTGGAAGNVAAPATAATLAGVPKDAAAATIQLRVYPSSYADWAAAEAAWMADATQTIFIGKSPMFNLAAIGGDFNTPPNLIGLQSFSLVANSVIPEPSTFALLGLGALGMMIFRRK